ncbi:hypothetical protein KIPB_010788 [Kipferlia bialata]|uniref:F5/8 type C domain-containing protein n=1 Tax=Kipferlia bialata TaxID=797122 RepID=A0A9K3D535_9EUKA|nr:hypothetical protein KIPB_010788 [Kipferlia bialata]|eukprot:g10788.t1
MTGADVEGEIMRADSVPLDTVGLMTKVPPALPSVKAGAQCDPNPTPTERVLTKRVDDLTGMVMNLAQTNMEQDRTIKQLHAELKTALSRLSVLESTQALPGPVSLVEAEKRLLSEINSRISGYQRVCFSGASAAIDCLYKVESWYPGKHIMQAVEERAARTGFSSVAGCYNDRDYVNGFSLHLHPSHAAAWISLEHSVGQYICLTFERPVALVGVATSGRQDYPERTERLAIEYFAPETRSWVPVDKSRPVYDANNDNNTVVLHALARPVVVKQVRVVVRQYNRAPCMRLEVFAYE